MVDGDIERWDRVTVPGVPTFGRKLLSPWAAALHSRNEDDDDDDDDQLCRCTVGSHPS
jgi:hypothetical protein